MTDKEFRRLSRAELIDIIFEYQKRERQYQQQLEELQLQLEDKRLRLNRAGSIAEAALSLNQVFEHAQAAADQYLAEAMAIYDSARDYAARRQADGPQE